MKNLLLPLLMLTVLFSCNSDSEFEIKRNYSYTLTKQEVKTHRLFTADGEIHDPSQIASIFSKAESNFSQLEFPKDSTVYNYDFTITFFAQTAVINQNNKLDTLKIRQANRIVVLESDTLQFIVPGTYDENQFANKIGKNSLNIIDQEAIPLYSGFGEKVTYTYEYIFSSNANQLILPRLFFFYYISFFPNGSTFSATTTNELNQEIYQYLDQGDTLLVNEINWIFE